MRKFLWYVCVLCVVHTHLITCLGGLQPQLIKHTEAYYRAKANAWLDDMPTPAYLVKVEEALVAEKERVGLCLHPSSERAVIRTAEVELLQKHEAALLESSTSGVLTLLRKDKLDDLARMFRLYSRLPNGLRTVGRLFKTHIQEQGLAIVRQREAAIAAAGGKESSSDPTFVRALLELHDKAKQVGVGRGCSFLLFCFAHFAVRALRVMQTAGGEPVRWQLFVPEDDEGCLRVVREQGGAEQVHKRGDDQRILRPYPEDRRVRTLWRLGPCL